MYCQLACHVILQEGGVEIAQREQRNRAESHESVLYEPAIMAMLIQDGGLYISVSL